jgi:hypothetical protein
MEGISRGQIQGTVPAFFLDRLKKIKKKLSQERRFPDRDFNPGPPEYEAEVLTILSRRSVRDVIVRRIASL